MLRFSRNDTKHSSKQCANIFTFNQNNFGLNSMKRLEIWFVHFWWNQFQSPMIKKISHFCCDKPWIVECLEFKLNCLRWFNNISTTWNRTNYAFLLIQVTKSHFKPSKLQLWFQSMCALPQAPKNQFRCREKNLFTFSAWQNRSGAQILDANEIEYRARAFPMTFNIHFGFRHVGAHIALLILINSFQHEVDMNAPLTSFEYAFRKRKRKKWIKTICQMQSIWKCSIPFAGCVFALLWAYTIHVNSPRLSTAASQAALASGSGRSGAKQKKLF